MYQTKEQPVSGFNKNKRCVFLTDNKSDEMMANVLELYPTKKQYIFQGKEGEMKRKALYNKVRGKFNMAADEDMFNASGRKVGRKLKQAGQKIGKKAEQIGKKVESGVKKAGQKVGEGLKKVATVVKKASLAAPRGAFLALVRLNFRGSASRFNLLNDAGVKKLNEKWEKLGGSKDALQRAIDAGKGKHPLACGKKCRASAGKNPQLPPDAQSDFVNFEPTTTTALISAGGAVLGATIKAVSDKSNYKSQIELSKLENDIAKAEDAEKKIDDTMTPQERALADEIIKAQDSSFDAVKAIQENPNLTAAEKTAAIAMVKQDLKGSGSTANNKLMIGLGVVAIIGLVYYFSQKK